MLHCPERETEEPTNKDISVAVPWDCDNISLDLLTLSAESTSFI